MLKRVRSTALILLGFSCTVAGLTLIATLTPGGIILGLFMFGLAVVIYFLWTMTRALLQIRELLMLSLSRNQRGVKTTRAFQADEEPLPSIAPDTHLDSAELHPDA